MLMHWKCLMMIMMRIGKMHLLLMKIMIYLFVMNLVMMLLKVVMKCVLMF